MSKRQIIDFTPPAEPPPGTVLLNSRGVLCFRPYRTVSDVLSHAFTPARDRRNWICIEGDNKSVPSTWFEVALEGPLRILTSEEDFAWVEQQRNAKYARAVR